MRILGIDPGTKDSAVILYDSEFGKVQDPAILPNGDICQWMVEERPHPNIDCLAIEQVACYGMAIGKETMETLCWIGRFVQAWAAEYCRIPRKTRWGPGGDTWGEEGVWDGVCMALCKNNRARDKNIRQALIDRFGPGKAAAIGTKKSPGPLYGLKSHLWPALAVAVVAADALEWQDGRGETP